MEFHLAEQVAADVLTAMEALNQALWKLKDHGTPEEFARHRQVVASVIASLDLDLLAKLYAEHPELERRDPGLHPENTSRGA